MPIKLNWLIEGVLAEQVFTGDVTLEDVEWLAESMIPLMDSSDRPLVHVIADVTEMTSLTKSVAGLQRVLKPVLSHPKYGWLVVYGMENKIIRFVFQLVTAPQQVRTRLFGSREECVTFLKTVDAHLSELVDEQQINLT
ncbi:MAG: hypothetical protein AAF125_22110 [Chloroflexota bacterium]